MCYICAQAPIEFLDEIFTAGKTFTKRADLECIKAEVQLIKDMVNEFETLNPCDEGKEVMEELKERQYKLSREL